MSTGASSSDAIHAQHSARLRGILCMLVAVGSFACLDTLLKLLAAHYPTMQVSALRGAASLPFLVLPALLMKSAQQLAPRRIGWHLFRGVLQIVTLGAFIYALRSLSLADTYAIFLSAPLMVTALSVPLFKEHVGWRRWLAIGVGLSGVLVMLRPSGSGLLTLGAIAALFSAAAYAAGVLTVRMLARTETAASITLWPLVVMTVVTGAYSIPGWVGVRAEHLGWIVAMGIVGALGTRMLTEAFRAAPASVVAPFEYTALVYGVAIDWLLWSKLPALRVVLGGALVIASGLFLIWRERQLRLARAATAPSP
ncbi:MAG TPA: DMT family transporter [Steroidobacteraceae bacterium]|nr:DMT family transporter [Steroidobacteraceae bacterium]